jgi:major membrane immunogen (membrane-anchored lipoprotein)
MKKYNSILKYIFIVITALLITGCVHDDKYDAPNLDDYQCRNASYYENSTNGFTKWTLHDLKLKTQSQTFTDKAYVEGYVSSTDETGNIYKTIYIQDDPTNPTEGLTVSVDMVSTYTKFPQGSKVYIELKGLAVTSYGNVVQLGMITDAGTRIPEKYVPSYIYRDCSVKATIVPKVMTFAQMVTANDKYIGCLIQVNNAEFDSKILCMNYAPDATTVDRVIRDNSTTTSRIVRNSGYASFANQIMPSGNGKFVGIYSKYNSTYQLYINRVSDLNMKSFPRLDGITADPCQFSSTGLTQKTIAEVKQLYTSGNWNQITGDFYVKAQVTANDETGNLYKYVYIEDATGGLRFNINKTNLYQDNRFRVGKDIYIKLKNLYLSNVSGEIQLGGLYNGGANFGGIEEVDIYKSVFDGNAPIRDVSSTERTISQLTTADVGRWIKLKGVQFTDADLYKPYAAGATTNRTLTDCNGKTIVLRTSNFATFAGKDVSGGKGDVYAILSAFNGTYQLWIPYQINANLSNPRCDGTVYTPLATIYGDDFSSGLVNWTAVSVTGAEVWTISNQGNSGNNYAMMNGYASGNKANEDWLISKEVSLVGKTKAFVSFTTDVRYTGNALQVYATDNYTGTPSTTTWTLLPATLDTNTGAFGDWASSGNVNLSAFLGKNVRIAFKYTSTTSAAATWEVDDFKIKGQ